MRSLRLFAELPAEFLAARGRFAWMARASMGRAIALQLAVLFLVGCVYAGLRFIPRHRYTHMLDAQFGRLGPAASEELVAMRKEAERLRLRVEDIRAMVIPQDRIGDLMENLALVCEQSGIRFGSLRRNRGREAAGLEQVLLTLSADGDFAGITRFLRAIESELALASPRQAQLFGGGGADAPLAARFVFGVVMTAPGKERHET